MSGTKAHAYTDPPNLDILYVKNNNTDKAHDLRDGFIQFSYYESLLSPYITGSLTYLDTGQGGVVDSQNDTPESTRTGTVINTLPLVAGEDIKVKLNHPSGVLDFSGDNQHFIVDSFKDYNSGGGERNSIVHLNLISKFGEKNKRTSIPEPQEGNIRNSLYTILRDKLGVPTSMLSKLENTRNSHNFKTNNRSPFHIAEYLAVRSMPVQSDSFGGYFFWESQTGFNFRAIDSLIRNSPVDNYTESDVSAGAKDVHASCRILKSSVIKRSDNSDGKNFGLFKTKHVEFNPYSFDMSEKTFNPLLQYDFSATLGSNSISAEYLDQYPLSDIDSTSSLYTNAATKSTYTFLDTGNNDTNPSSNVTACGISTALNNDPSQWKTSSSIRYNLLMSNIVDIVVPCNLHLKAGQSIRCHFPKLTSGNKNEGSSDERISGKYLILDLSHKFQNESTFGSLTHMRLVRDTNGLYNAESSSSDEDNTVDT